MATMQMFIIGVFLAGAIIGYGVGLADARWWRAHRPRSNESTPPTSLLKRLKHRIQAH